MAYEQVHECVLPAASSSENSYIPSPEGRQTDDLCPPAPPPPTGFGLTASRRDQVGVRKSIKVEPGERHDDIKQLVLYPYEYPRREVKWHDALVVGRV